MALKKLYATVTASSLETRLSLLATAAGMANLWLGLLIGLVVVWRLSAHGKFDFDSRLAIWYFAPTALALALLSRGTSLPSDDLMRHLMAGGLGYDYREQYPWSDLPEANLWLGFDWVLWKLQVAGASKEFLLQWVPGLCLLLQSCVLYGALKRVVPAHRTNSALFLIAGALGLLMMTQRSLLGRPEMFILLFAATAWLPRSGFGVGAWVAGYLLMVPAYWLGWAYAPFALLLWPSRLTLRTRIGITVLLALAHLGFWQLYTGDYIALMRWLKGTLAVRATENAEIFIAFSQWPSWILFGAMTLAASLLTRRRLVASSAVLLLFVWFVLPNQVRYIAALVLVGLPWTYRQLVVWQIARAHRIPQAVVLLALGAAALLTVRTTEKPPAFELPASARVYSESPYAAAFFGAKGISIDPSFALGATKAPWDQLKNSQLEGEHCQLLAQGKFTHVVERSRNSLLECGELEAVQGPWRLWRLN